MSSFALGRPEGLGLRSAGAALIGFAGLLGLAAVVIPAHALAVVVGGAFVAVAVWNLAAGVAVFTALTFFEELPGLSDFPLVKATGAVLAFSWAIAVFERRNPPPLLARERPLLSAAAVFIVALSLASALWSTSSGAAISSGIRLAQGVLLIFIVYTAVRELRHLVWIIAAFVGGAALTAVVGLAGGSSSEELGPYAETSRLAGGIGDANEFAALLVPSLVFAAFAIAIVRTALARLALLGALGLITLALFLTESRGGIVALAVTVVAVAVYAGPLRTRALAALCCVVALGVTYYAFVAPPESLTRITQFSAGGGTGRSDLWTIAIEMWRDRPFAGIGSGNFQIVEPRYAVGAANLARVDLVIDTPKVAHNTYLHVLTELGLVGLAGFLLTIGAGLAAGIRAVRDFARGESLAGELVARSLVIGAIGMLAAFTFISAQYEKQLWLMLGLLAASLSVSRREPTPEPARAPQGVGRRLASAEEDGEYDRAVSERLAEQLDQRLAERLDTLAKEQERLERSRAALATRERELRERLASAEAANRERSISTAGLEELRARLDEREKSLAAFEARLREREEVLDNAGVGAGGEALRAAQAASERLSSQLADLDALRTGLEERAADLDARSRVIKELELHKGSTEESTAMQRELAAELERREAELGERELMVAAQLDRQEHFTGVQGRLVDESAADLVRRRRELDEAEERWAEEDERLSVLRSELAREGEVLAKRQADLERGERELAETRDHVAAARVDLDGRERELVAQRETLAAQAAQTDDERAAVDAERERIAGMAAAIAVDREANDRLASEAAVATAALESERQQLAARASDLEARAAAVARSESELLAREAELSARVEELEERRASLVEDDERRLRTDAVLAEREHELEEVERRLEEVSKELAARERELAEARATWESQLPARESALSAMGDERATELAELEHRLAERERELVERLEEAERLHAERVQAITQRELAVARAAAVQRGPQPTRAAEPPVVAPESAGPAQADPGPTPLDDADTALWTLPELERLVEEHSEDEQGERADEWRYTLLSLREFADVSGRLPASFDGLMDEVFGELVDKSKRR